MSKKKIKSKKAKMTRRASLIKLAFLFSGTSSSHFELKMGLTLGWKCFSLLTHNFDKPREYCTEKRKKYIEQWWRKYEVMNAMEAEIEEKFPTPPEVFFELVESAYQAWLNTGKTAAQIEAEIQHHIAMQKVFKKWRKVHGEKI